MTKPNHLTRRKRYIAAGVAALAITGGGLTVANAQSAPPTTPTSQQPADTGQNGDQADANITSSVTAPEAPDTGKDNEAADNASLTKLAKVTPDQAKAAALKAVPGNAAAPELSNENGNVVYDVTVTSPDGKTSTDVKVDAGNANVLAQQVDNQANDGEQRDNAKSEQPEVADSGQQGGQAETGN